jgi:hypothetical protein
MLHQSHVQIQPLHALALPLFWQVHTEAAASRASLGPRPSQTGGASQAKVRQWNEKSLALQDAAGVQANFMFDVTKEYASHTMLEGLSSSP